MTYSLRDYFSAYAKVAGFFCPTRFVWRPFGELLEVDRCAVDREIVGESQISLSRHAGHRMYQPTKLTILEALLVWFRVIK